MVRGGHRACVSPIMWYMNIMRIFVNASAMLCVMLLMAALVVAVAFPHALRGGPTAEEEKAVSMSSGPQQGRQESGGDAGTSAVHPTRPGHTTGEPGRPEPTPEELKRLEKRVLEGTHLPGPPLPEVGTPEPPPPDSQTTPKEAPKRGD
jgi:hypothetical protein